MREIPNKYDATATEQRWRDQWEQWGIHKWDPSLPRDATFVVDTPPPTVSGELHIGHCFSYTHQDLIVRYQRMRGRNIHYGMGWDDNGLPTERRVQNVFGIRCEPRLPYNPDWKPKKSGSSGKNVEEISRQNFIEACDLLTREDEQAFEFLWRHLGLSIDWSETYATIDDHCRKIAQLSFLDLVARGYVYQADSPAMWDVDFRTAVAQAEIQDRDHPGAMHDIRFGVPGYGEISVATTRPELLPACIAVVAHPSDERYQSLFGRKAVSPLFEAEVPIVAAEHADPEKGTGILMICTFGDAADVEWWRTNRAPLRQVIDSRGRLLRIQFGESPFDSRNPSQAQAYYDELVGLPMQEARVRVAEILSREGTGPGGNGTALIGEPRPLTHPVKFYEKGYQPLEFLPARQWFIKILDYKDVLIEQGRKIQWHPEYMRTRYEHWVAGLNQDWCISRQRYFGVPFPVWYPLDSEGRPDHAAPIFADPKVLPVDPQIHAPPGHREEQRNSPGGFAADPDVMDTWVTSSMTPQIQSRWRVDEARHRQLFPMHIRPQAHEIIRTWAFYTIVKAWMHENKIPWEHVMISGWVLDPDRKKMSKSKGNVSTPIAILDEYTVDAVRYWSGRARLGTDTTFDEAMLKIGKRLATKVFNASRFVFMQLDRVRAEGDAVQGLEHVTEPLDLSLIARLRRITEEATRSFEMLEYAPALQAAEGAFWEFCDHYLELVKVRSYAEEKSAARDSAIATLQFAISVFLRLFAPFMPYVTEEVWSWRLAGKGRLRSIHTSPWPSEAELASADLTADDEAFVVVVEVLSKIRRAKSEAKKTLKWPVASLVVGGSLADWQRLQPVLPDILASGRVAAGDVRYDSSLQVEDERVPVRVTLGEE